MSDLKVKVKSALSRSGYDLTASSEDTLSVVKQNLLALGVFEQPITSFVLEHNGVKLSNETLIAELIPKDETVTLEMRLEKLNLTDVTYQISQLREVLGLGDLCSTYVNAGATRINEIKRGSKKGKKLSEEEVAELAELPELNLANYNSETTMENLSGDMQTAKNHSIVSRPNSLITKASAVELKLSHWQSLCRTPQVKLQGIIAFIVLISNDGKEWHFIATQHGFAYIPGLNNKNLVLPLATLKSVRYLPSLFQAIEQVSPSTINGARKNSEKIKADPLGCVPVPQVVSTAPWLVGDVPDVSSLNASNFEQTPEASLHDWNEEYQTTRELVPESFSERIMRDRSLCQTATDFANAANEGVVKIVEGAIPALNPFEEVESAKFYLSKGIFYTYGSDFSQAYAGVTSEQGAKKAVKKAINGVEQLMVLNIPDLCPVLTAVIDYCGRRMVAQAPVPGIFREVPLIVYGQAEDPEVVHYDENMDKLMKQFAEHLHLKKHPVTPEGVELQTSAEVHGAKSTDGRLYAIDLHRMQAPDLLFEGENELDLLRFEAIVDFYAQNPEAGKLNPDVWMDSSRYPKEYAKTQLPKDIETVKAVGNHVREELIPSFVNNIADGSGIDPIDGVHLTALMHRKGINMRHLGRVHNLANAAELISLACVSFEEAVARSLKVMLRKTLESVDSIENVPAEAEHFVAGFRGTQESLNEGLIKEVETRLIQYFGFSDLPKNWTSVFLPRISLLRLLSLKCGLQWNEDLKLVAINPVIRYSFPRSLTAADAIEAGRISLEAVTNPSDPKEDEKDGNDENIADEDTTSAAIFHEKEARTPSPELLEQTLAIVSQAVGIFSQIYGTTHAEVAHVLNQVATLFYEYGNDTNKAIEYVRKAITIAERVKGLDSYDVIVMHNNLACFERSAGHWAATIEVSNRIISTIDSIAWPGFSDLATPFETVAVMLLQSQKKRLQEVSLEWFARAIELAKQKPSGPSGILWFQYAQAQIFQQDYKNAARSMKSSYTAFKFKNGVDDPSTKEVKTYLDQLLKLTVSTAQSERARALSTLNRSTNLSSGHENTRLGQTGESTTILTSKKNKKKSNKKKSKAKQSV